MREPVALDRTNIAFHRLYAWSRLFLSARWQSTTTGDALGVALLFPMNDLFETFVGRAMQSALAPGSTRLQPSGRHALTDRDRPLFVLRPDIVVDDDIVIDTKWKELAPDGRNLGVDQSDVYQMLVYTRAFDAGRVVLLYPWRQGLPPPRIYRRWTIAGTSKPFDIAAVDVGQPDSVATQLREIIRGPGRSERSELLGHWAASAPEAV